MVDLPYLFMYNKSIVKLNRQEGIVSFMKSRKLTFIITAIVLFMLLLSVSAAAEGAQLNHVTVDFVIKNIPVAQEGNVVLNLYDETGTVLLATNSYPYVRGNGWFRADFEVPEYPIGTKFVLSLAEGAQGIKFGDVTETEHIVETYLYTGEDGSAQYQTCFYMELIPTWYKQATIKIPGSDKKEYYHCVMGDEVYVTTDLLSELEINFKADTDSEKPSLSH